MQKYTEVCGGMRRYTEVYRDVEHTASQGSLGMLVNLLHKIEKDFEPCRGALLSVNT